MSAKYSLSYSRLEAMQVPNPPKSPQDFMDWGRFGSWLGTGGNWRLTEGVGSPLEVDSPDGKLVVPPGTWIIKGARGELCPCDPEMFKALFARVE